MEDIRQSMKDLVCSPYDIEINVSTTRLFWIIVDVIVIGLAIAIIL